jgi:ubiquinone biosynthesis protein UbiJ
VLLRGACEQLLNRWVAGSTAAAEHIAALEGESLAIEIVGLDLTLVLVAHDARVRLATARSVPTSATLRGGPLDLLRLLSADSLGDLKRTGAELSGNLHVAEAFAEALRMARPDAEAELADWIGDLGAHELGGFSRRLLGLGRSARRSLEFSLAEYLKEESRSTPGPLELSAFSSEVERLRDDVERAAKRLERAALRIRPKF